MVVRTCVLRFVCLLIVVLVVKIIVKHANSGLELSGYFQNVALGHTRQGNVANTIFAQQPVDKLVQMRKAVFALLVPCAQFAKVCEQGLEHFVDFQGR